MQKRQGQNIIGDTAVSALDITKRRRRKSLLHVKSFGRVDAWSKIREGNPVSIGFRLGLSQQRVKGFKVERWRRNQGVDKVFKDG